MPIVKSVGGISAEQAEQDVDGQAQDLADEVVQGDVEGALGRAVAADRGVHRVGPSSAARAGRIVGVERERLDGARAAAGRPRPSSPGVSP